MSPFFITLYSEYEILKLIHVLSGALLKKIKVALQVQTVPAKILQLTCPKAGLRFSSLVAIEPRRRRFHNAIEVAIPLSIAKDPSRVRLLCSLAASSTPKAVFEDVTEMTPISLSKGNRYSRLIGNNIS